MSPSVGSVSVLLMPTWIECSEGLGKCVGIDGTSTNLARLSVIGEEAWVTLNAPHDGFSSKR